MDLLQELAAVVSALDAAGIEYALCGGLALAVHGAPRATKDIDLLVPEEKTDAARAVLRACGFELEALPLHFHAANISMRRVSKVSDGQIVVCDLLLAGDALRDALSSRARVAWQHGTLWVVSRAALISMKLTAGRSQDLADVEKLAGGPE